MFLHDEPIGNKFSLTEKGEDVFELLDSRMASGDQDAKHDTLSGLDHDVWLVLFLIKESHTPRIRKVMFKSNRLTYTSWEAVILRLRELNLIYAE